MEARGGNRRSIKDTAVDESRKETADRVARHQCCQDYLGLGNRSIFYPHSSVPGRYRNTFTFYVVQVTGSILTSNVSFTEMLARAHLKKHISLDPQEMKRSG